MIARDSDHIRIESHRGTWYVIGEDWYALTPDENGRAKTYQEHVFLLEHETYGDEAACLIVNKDGKLIMEDVWNGFEDLEDAGWEQLPKVATVHLSDGDTITTRVNGDVDECREYYRVGSMLNTGTATDHMVKVISVEIEPLAAS